ENPPSAMFATRHLRTHRVLRAMDEAKLSTPHVISVLTFDDFDFAPYLRCPRTAVWQPKDMMGEMAMKLLRGQLQLDGQEPHRILLKTHLRIRESVARVGSKRTKSGR